MNLGLATAILALGCTSAAASPVSSLVQAQGPANMLHGTMIALPDAPKAPIVLIIPGSGPTDRDGNSPLGVKAASYRLLAEALAARGVASVRIDKRGMFASAAPNVEANRVTMPDYAADVHAWAAVIKHQTGAPCVWPLGHSEGGLVAILAAQNPTDICGVIMVSAAGRPLADILREQLKANPANAPLLPRALPAIDELAAGHHVDVTGMNPALLQIFAPQVQDFIIAEMAYDPAKLVAAYKGPVLVLQGTTDIQTSMVDAERLASARPGVTLVKLDGVNHMLKAAPADRAAQMPTYTDPDLPLAPAVADAIAGFVKTH